MAYYQRNQWVKGNFFNNQPSSWSKNPTGITIHWQGSDLDDDTVEDSIETLNAILRDHLSRINQKTKRKEYATIAYNYAIDRLGNVFELRGRALQSGAQYPGNDDDIAVVFLVDKDEELSNEARESFSALKSDLAKTGVGDLIHTHGPDWTNTDCPGDKIRAWVDGVTPTTPPPPTTPTAPGRKAFPLPRGHYYGKFNKFDDFNHSGYYNEKDRSAIREIQKTIGSTAGVADGKFGPITDTAVRHYQQINGLRVDGLVGPITWKRLFR